MSSSGVKIYFLKHIGTYICRYIDCSEIKEESRCTKQVNSTLMFLYCRIIKKSRDETTSNKWMCHNAHNHIALQLSSGDYSIVWYLIIIYKLLTFFTVMSAVYSVLNLWISNCYEFMCTKQIDRFIHFFKLQYKYLPTF